MMSHSGSVVADQAKARPAASSGSATCQMRPPVWSECAPQATMATTAKKNGMAVRKPIRSGVCP